MVTQVQDEDKTDCLKIAMTITSGLAIRVIVSSCYELNSFIPPKILHRQDFGSATAPTASPSWWYALGNRLFIFAV